MKVIVEVKQPTGDVRSGNAKATGKPYKMAEQEVAVFIPGSDYPVVGKRDIYVPQDKQAGTFGEPEWMKPGRYSVDVKIRADRFNRIEPVIDWRHAQPFQEAAKPQPTARAA